MVGITPVVLSVGTTHPLGIAGLNLDLRAGPLLGVRVIAVVAGISAQSASTVIARQAVAPAIIAAQFAALSHTCVGAVHVGALLDASSVAAVARELKAFDVPVVCDPVIAASGGGRLADEATVAALVAEIFPRCTLVTPNLAEAALLLGRNVANVAAMESAARALRASGAQAVLLKGGHLDSTSVTDVLVDSDGDSVLLSAPRITASLRGTGDLLACAIAASLAHGNDLRTSIISARTFVRERLVNAVEFAGTWTLPV